MKKILFFLVILIIFLGVGIFYYLNLSKKPTQEKRINATKEKDFNASGKAKAIVNETDMWKVYEDKQMGFSFKYPTNYMFLKKDEFIVEPEFPLIKVEIKEIGQQDVPWDLTKEEALKNIEALSSGQYGVKYDEPVPESKKVTPVGHLFAQDFIVLSRFDICNMTLQRILLFYFNNKQITITSSAPFKKLKASSPYIVVDNECGEEEKRWDFDNKGTFYKDLVDKKTVAEVQEWFEQFDQIAQTITFAHK